MPSWEGLPCPLRKGTTGPFPLGRGSLGACLSAKLCLWVRGWSFYEPCFGLVFEFGSSEQAGVGGGSGVDELSPLFLCSGFGIFFSSAFPRAIAASWSSPSRLVDLDRAWSFSLGTLSRPLLRFAL